MRPRFLLIWFLPQPLLKTLVSAESATWRLVEQKAELPVCVAPTDWLSSVTKRKDCRTCTIYSDVLCTCTCTLAEQRRSTVSKLFHRDGRFSRESLSDRRAVVAALAASWAPHSWDIDFLKGASVKWVVWGPKQTHSNTKPVEWPWINGASL